MDSFKPPGAKQVQDTSMQWNVRKILKQNPPASIAKQELGSSRMIKFCFVRRISGQEMCESLCGWGLCWGIPPTGIIWRVPLLAVNIGSVSLRTHIVDEPFCTSPSWHSLKKDFPWCCFDAKCAGVLCHLRHIAATCSGSKRCSRHKQDLSARYMFALVFLQFEDKKWDRDRTRDGVCLHSSAEAERGCAKCSAVIVEVLQQFYLHSMIKNLNDVYILPR